MTSNVRLGVPLVVLLVMCMVATVTRTVHTYVKLREPSPGKYIICYSMLENLSNRGKDILLNLINRIWRDGGIPKAWK